MSNRHDYLQPGWDVRITDTSLRDGSHHKRHQFTKDEVRQSWRPSTPPACR